MTEEERKMWELFCMTGEPRYYSMYAEMKNRNRDEIE